MWPSLDILTGYAILVFAVVALSPWWVPALCEELRYCIAICVAFNHSIPARCATVAARWRGTRNEIAFAVILLCLSVGGTIWVNANSVERSPILFFAVGLLTLFSIVFGPLMLWDCLKWVAGGFALAAQARDVSPLNRVGIAAPLGEARFANLHEAREALSGDKSALTPPQFRD